jgi:hypothetical protein
MAETRIFPFELRFTTEQVNRFETLYDDIRSSDSSARTATVPFAGICLAPKKDTDGSTIGLSVVLVGFQPTSTGPDLLEMYPSSPGASSAMGYSFTSADTALLSIPFTDTSSQISLLSRILDYDRTREFGLVFIDRETLEYFVTTNFYTGTTTPTDRGITIARALVHFSTKPERSLAQFFSDNESGVYRTVKVSPYPPVTLLTGDDSRSSVAYYIGPTCPPFWHVDDEPATPPMRQIVNPKEPPQTCNMYTINRKHMIKKLVEMKYLPAEPFPLYKTRRWTLIAAALVSLAVSILGIISLVRGDIFGKFG